MCCFFRVQCDAGPSALRHAELSRQRARRRSGGKPRLQQSPPSADPSTQRVTGFDASGPVRPQRCSNSSRWEFCPRTAAAQLERLPSEDLLSLRCDGALGRACKPVVQQGWLVPSH